MSSGMYKYNEHIDTYMNMVDSGDVQACEDLKQLMKYLRFKLEQPNVTINADAIEKSISIPAKYFPYELYPWQKFINAFIYGVYENGELMFKNFMIMLGRGAGKNGYLAYNAFYMLTGYHGIRNYDIELVSNAERQSKRTFDDVYNVLTDKKHTEMLGKAFYKPTKVLIKHRGTKSILEYNTANAWTKDGLRPGAVFFDEIHLYEDYEQINVFTSAMGKTKNPRIFYITTNGYIREGVLDDKLNDAKLVLSGEAPESKLFPFICRLDNEEEVHDFNMWEKANPSIRYNDNLYTAMLEAYEEMRKYPSLRREFMTKRMNLPLEDELRAVANYNDILATNQPMPDGLETVECIGGIDYAEIKDFCAVGLLFKANGKRYWIHHTFIQRKAVDEQNINRKIIDEACEAGLITFINEPTIGAEPLINWFSEMGKRYYIKKINCDSYRARLILDAFKEAGMPPVNIVRKGAPTHSVLAPVVEEMFAKHNIAFPNDCLMRWYVNNIYVHEHANGNKEYLKIDKVKRKADGWFAFLHALNSLDDISDGNAINFGSSMIYQY